MIAFLTSVLLAAAIGNAELSSDEEIRAQQVYKYVFRTADPNRGVHSRLLSIPEEDQDLVRRYLRARIEAQPARSEKESSIYYKIEAAGGGYQLAVLGDEQGLEHFAAKFREKPWAEWRYEFKDVRNAKLIPMIGDLLFKEEKYEESDDLGFPPTQWAAALGILETLKYAPQFQPDVWQWGQDLDGARSKPVGDVINILREWYRENEEKLRAGEFDEVRAGRHPVVEAKTEPSVPTPIPGASSSVRENSSTTRVSEKSEERTPSVSASFWGYVGGAIGCLALLVVLWLWMRRSST